MSYLHRVKIAILSFLLDLLRLHRVFDRSDDSCGLKQESSIFSEPTTIIVVVEIYKRVKVGLMIPSRRWQEHHHFLPSACCLSLALWGERKQCMRVCVSQCVDDGGGRT